MAKATRIFYWLLLIPAVFMALWGLTTVVIGASGFQPDMQWQNRGFMALTVAFFLFGLSGLMLRRVGQGIFANVVMIGAAILLLWFGFTYMNLFSQLGYSSLSMFKELKNPSKVLELLSMGLALIFFFTGLFAKPRGQNQAART